MTRMQGVSSLSEKSPWFQLLVLIVYVFIIGGLIFLVLLIPGLFIFDPSSDLFKDSFSNPGRNDAGFLLYIMISQHLSLFILPGFILLPRIAGNKSGNFPEFNNPGWSSVWKAIILFICMVPVISLAAELNLLIKLPQGLSGIAEWIRERENYSEKIFDMFFVYKSLIFVICNSFMLVILPGIGEELIFRGLLQPVIGRILKSDNLAVIITAAIFSAGHLEFYGFIPRFVIGLLLGFIFLWTGKLWLSIVLHSMNNALVLIAGYAGGPGQSSVQEPGYLLAGQIVLMLILLFPAIKMLKEFRMQYSPRPPDSVPESIQADLM